MVLNLIWTISAVAVILGAITIQIPHKAARILTKILLNLGFLGILVLWFTVFTFKFWGG